MSETKHKKEAEHKPKKEADSSESSSSNEDEKEKFPYSGPIKRRQVAKEFTHGVLKVREFEDCEKVKHGVLLEGFPSVSLTSIIASNFIIDQMKLPLVGVITSDEMPARAVVDNGQPAHPIRIFGNESLCVWVSEFKLVGQAVFDMVKAMFAFYHRHEMKSIVTMEGLPTERNKNDFFSHKPEDDVVHFISTMAEVDKVLLESGCKPVPTGLIDGVTGAVLTECVYETPEVEVLCLLTPTVVQFPDAHAAANIVKIINKVEPTLQIDIKPLDEQAGISKVEKTVKSLLAQSGAISTQQPSMMYG